MTNEVNEIAEAIRDGLGDTKINFNLPEAIRDSFRRFDDGHLEPATIVDVIETLADSTKRIADSITPGSALPGPCPSGEGHVGSLTESVMGLTRAMMQIALAIERVADAIESH